MLTWLTLPWMDLSWIESAWLVLIWLGMAWQDITWQDCLDMTCFDSTCLDWTWLPYHPSCKSELSYISLVIWTTMIYVWVNGQLEYREERWWERRIKLVHTLTPRLWVGLGRAGLGLGCTLHQVTSRVYFVILGKTGYVDSAPLFWTESTQMYFKPSLNINIYYPHAHEETYVSRSSIYIYKYPTKCLLSHCS